MRKPFITSLGTVPLEQAHGGQGQRQVILSKEQGISSNLEIMTKGFLITGQRFTRHKHDDLDEVVVVIKGEGSIVFDDGSSSHYHKDDVVYLPAGCYHEITAIGVEDSEYFFFRIRV